MQRSTGRLKWRKRGIKKNAFDLQDVHSAALHRGDPLNSITACHMSSRWARAAHSNSSHKTCTALLFLLLFSSQTILLSEITANLVPFLSFVSCPYLSFLFLLVPLFSLLSFCCHLSFCPCFPLYLSLLSFATSPYFSFHFPSSPQFHFLLFFPLPSVLLLFFPVEAMFRFRLLEIWLH